MPVTRPDPSAERPRARALAAVLALSLALAPGLAARAAGSGLTAQELQQLAAGELVTRPESKRRGRTRLIGGSSWQVVDAPPDVVWRALLDTKYYPRMLPEVDEARVTARTRGPRGDSARTVFVRHQTGPIDASYYMDVRIDQERREMRFTIDKNHPHDVRGAWGIYALRPYAKGKSLLAYRVMADIDGGLIGLLVESLVHKWLLRPPMTVRRFVEGSGKYIYKY